MVNAKDQNWVLTVKHKITTLEHSLVPVHVASIAESILFLRREAAPRWFRVTVFDGPAIAVSDVDPTMLYSLWLIDGRLLGPSPWPFCGGFAAVATVDEVASSGSDRSGFTRIWLSPPVSLSSVDWTGWENDSGRSVVLWGFWRIIILWIHCMSTSLSRIFSSSWRRAPRKYLAEYYNKNNTHVFPCKNIMW